MRIYARTDVADPRRAGASNLTAAALSFANKPMKPVLTKAHRKVRRAQAVRGYEKANEQRKKAAKEEAFKYLF